MLFRTGRRSCETDGGTLLRFLILLVYAATIPLAFLILFGIAVWLSDHTHHFGSCDVRYLLLIRGTQVGNLDLVEPIAGTVQYTGRGEEGTAPTYLGAAFKTRVSPDAVIDTYSLRCRTSGLSVKRQPGAEQKPAITCERDDETAAISIEAGLSEGLTEVVIAGWEFP